MSDLQKAHDEAKERWRRRHYRLRTEDPRCGTVAGYLAHRRRKPKERPCKPCRMAWADYYREKRKKT